MVSPDNILMYLLPEQETQVRKIFVQLAESGFPQQNQRPHIMATLMSIMRLAVTQRAAEVLPPLMPAESRRVGAVTFDTKSKQTTAWLLETNDELEETAHEISRLDPDGRGSCWIPYPTVDLRIPRDIVPDYTHALDEIASPHFETLNAPRTAF